MIYVRVDANQFIGMGHLMRCLTVALALKKIGEKITFIISDIKCKEIIEQSGFETICLENDYSKKEEEVSTLIKLLVNNDISFILVDSYYVTNNYFSELKKISKVIYFDDLNTQCWDVNILINYNVYASKLDYSEYRTKDTVLLLGTQYAPLRDEFKKNNITKINKDVKNIFVSAGGADPEKITELIISKICSKWDNVQFHFVVGNLNSRIDNLKNMSKENVIIHINETNMSKLMCQCDIAISAAGTTLYELCACGIPTITYTLADNQFLAANEFDAKSIMLNVGDCRENKRFALDLNDTIKQLVENTSLRKQMSEKMKKLVNGKGALEIAQNVINL